MNRFFERRAAHVDSPRFDIPVRVYALLIDGEDNEFVLFDAVKAEAFDLTYTTPSQILRGSWRQHVDRAPIYAIEVNSLDGGRAAIDWLDQHPRSSLPSWSEIQLSPDPNGEAEVYDNIAGPPQRARIKVQPLPARFVRQIEQATDLGPEIKPESEIGEALSHSPIEHVFVLDVGQGAAAALVDSNDEIVAYVDLGAGVLRDVGTWPTSMGDICLLHSPTIILTHWHYDHFQAANIYCAAQMERWIAPYQKLGAGPQSAMAASILSSGGKLLIWSGSGILTAGAIELERCSGPSGDQNRSGIAVWVHGPTAADPILLPGDAGYSDVASLAAGQAISALVVSHHGGRAAGKPPARPTGQAPRAAFSYGHSNKYGHPLSSSLSDLVASRWQIGHPATGLDDRRTVDRPGGVGGLGLGHIRLNWAGGAGPHHACSCGCTLDPTQ